MPFEYDQSSAEKEPDKPVTGAVTPGMIPRSIDRQSIALPYGTKARLCQVAIERGCTVSDLVRQAIAAYLGWTDILDARPPGRPLDAAKDRIVKERRERIPIPTCVNVPRRRHQRGL